MKEDLSTFNIEILQISKRIAPKSGLRGIAPHPQPILSPPSAALGSYFLRGSSLGLGRLPRHTEEIAPLSPLTPEAETWEASPLARSAPRRPLLPRWASHPLRSILPLALPYYPAGALNGSLPLCFAKRALLQLPGASGAHECNSGLGMCPRLGTSKKQESYQIIQLWV